MCRRVTCPVCGKPTFAGCGAHVEQVLGDVAPKDRCQGHDARAAEPAPSASPSWRLFGR